jgi:hypothetical protein
MVILLAAPAAALAQASAAVAPGARLRFAFEGQKVDIIESIAVEAISPIRDSPFSAEAVTEFTQTLGDGNRIERRYSSSLARDSRGRTRRQEEIAMVGPLAVNGPPPTLVTIHDPEAGVGYTLDENQRIAYRNRTASAKLMEAARMLDQHAAQARATVGVFHLAGSPATVAAVQPTQQAGAGVAVGATRIVTESLGTRTIEGVVAEGTRTTSTIPAGAIGNVLPIEIVSERWFSPELQEPVLITRRDPRSGETTYRLANIIRSEPPQDLFTVPGDYQVRDGALGKLHLLREAAKVEAGAKVR